MKTIVLIFTIFAVISGFLAQQGTFYMTGTQWFEGCYELKVVSKGWGDSKTPDSQKAIIWESCEPLNKRTVYEAGFVFAGRAKNNQDILGIKLEQACPMQMELPMGGIYLLTLNVLFEKGGPTIFDEFLPADQMIRRVWEERWPDCNSERTRQGYPKIIEVEPGKFDWEVPCEVCKKGGRVLDLENQ